MENLEQNASFDSSPVPQSGILGSLPNPLKPSSSSAAAVDDGPPAESTPSNLNELLSWLQTLIGQLKQSGVTVRLFQNPGMLKIGLENVSLCQEHKFLYAGQKCPFCS